MDGDSAPTDLQWLWDQQVALRWLLVDEYTPAETDAAVAVCAEIRGLFVEAGSNVGPATLLGCRPELPLRRALDALARGVGNPGGAPRHRRIDATIFSIAQDGSATSVGASLHASVVGVGPSRLGEGLLDVTFDSAVHEAMPPGAEQISELWRAGRPDRAGQWADFDPALRHQWLRAAAHHQHDFPDGPADAVCRLDGRNVTTVDGFYCAIGEAINGPAGYFGSNADALEDCLRAGGFGAVRPVRLVWHDSAVARTHLAAPGRTLDQIVRQLTDHDIEVELL